MVCFPPHPSIRALTLGLTLDISLQLSTSICPPFNPYQPFRRPDHFSRPRYPVILPQHPKRPTPPRATSYDEWQTQRRPEPSYPANQQVSNSHATCFQHCGTPSGAAGYTPASTDLDSAFLSYCSTPIDADVNNLWDESQFTQANSPDLWHANQLEGLMLQAQNAKDTHHDFGLGLGSLGNDFSPVSTKGGDMIDLAFSSAPGISEETTHDAESPQSGSWSSISDGSHGMMSDFPDFSTETELKSAQPEIPSAYETFVPPSRVSTPSLVHRGFARSNSRSVVEASPRARFRASPYPNAAARNRSFSTGSVALSRTQRSASFIDTTHVSTGYVSHHPSASSSCVDLTFVNEPAWSQPLASQMPSSFFDADHTTFSSPLAQYHTQSTIPRPIQSVQETNVLHSSHPTIADQHYGCTSDPPNLFGPLECEPCSPPPEDMDPEDPDMIPRVQELRFEGDLYTPKYIRGHGNKREGWCGICKPGRWLVLKNSAFWYDKSFTHGISHASGVAFEAPKETRRMKSNPDVWEGLCGSCEEWIALISSKKKGTTWFRHAYKVPSTHVAR